MSFAPRFLTRQSHYSSSNFRALQSGESSRRCCRIQPGTWKPLFTGSKPVSLDFLLDYFPVPSTLKIDAETHETRVLQGATKLLETVRPTIWCEVSPENAAAVFDLLHPLDYELYAAATEVRVPLKRASWDTCGPKGRI
jgi:hypothetical protein